MLNSFHIEGTAALFFVRFDTADVMRLLRRQLFHQFGHGVFEEEPSSWWATIHFSHCFSSIREHRPQQTVLAVVEKPLEILKQRVFVLVHEAFDWVCHVASIVGHSEDLFILKFQLFHFLPELIKPDRLVLLIQVSAGVVSMRTQCFIQLFQEHLEMEFVKKSYSENGLTVSVTFPTVTQASSRTENIPVRGSSTNSQMILLLKYSIFVHLIPSLSYSSCSCFNTSSMNSCWSFSLQ